MGTDTHVHAYLLTHVLYLSYVWDYSLLRAGLAVRTGVPHTPAVAVAHDRGNGRAMRARSCRPTCSGCGGTAPRSFLPRAFADRARGYTEAKLVVKDPALAARWPACC